MYVFANTNRLFWVFFSALTTVLLIVLLWLPPLNFGGDIVEYHGITESLIKSGGIHLTQEVKDNLSNYLQPSYLVDPQYYMTGRNGERYPVHFILYSFIALPFRLLLKLFQLNELHTLRVTNLFLLTAACAVIIKQFIPENKKRLFFLLTVYLSPLLWFIIWPGADVFYLSVLLVGIFYFLRKHLITGIILTIIASWHSQPLVITAAGLTAYYIFQKITFELREDRAHISIVLSTLAKAAALGALATIPYLYNLIIFGTLTPWSVLQDGWSRINGFGPQNMSLWKFFEQWFDLNVGLFWYAPVLFVAGIYAAIRHARHDRSSLVLFIVMLVTAFFYQTNPAWHYGTSGYGPSRHAIFFLPFLIYFTYTLFVPVKKYVFLVLFLILTQGYILWMNNGLYPNLLNTLSLSPYAKFVLNYAPSLYNPTPEIFVDRASHTDLSYPSSAFYMHDGKCKKAYVLITDLGFLKDTCGTISSDVESKFDDPYLRKTNFARKTKTISATFWPDPGSCGNNFFPTPERPYVCMKTITDVIKQTGVLDADRFVQVDTLPGVWRMKDGPPVQITIPAGYFIQHYSFEGMYVNF